MERQKSQQLAARAGGATRVAWRAAQEGRAERDNAAAQATASVESARAEAEAATAAASGQTAQLRAHIQTLPRRSMTRTPRPSLCSRSRATRMRPRRPWLSCSPRATRPSRRRRPPRGRPKSRRGQRLEGDLARRRSKDELEIATQRYEGAAARCALLGALRQAGAGDRRGGDVAGGVRPPDGPAECQPRDAARAWAADGGGARGGGRPQVARRPPQRRATAMQRMAAELEDYRG